MAFPLPFANPFGNNSPLGVITPAKVMQLAYDLRSVKWYYTSMGCLLLYDYMLTFSSEVKYAWKGRKGPVFLLFLWMRYFPMVFCTIMLVSYFSPLWTFEICNRFAIAIWVQTVLIFVPAEIVMTLRVWALSKKNIWIVAPLCMLTLAQFAVSVRIWSSHANGALKLPPLPVEGFHICMLYPSPKIAQTDTTFLGMNLGFDSAVFGLTMFFTIRAATLGKNPLVQSMQRDGTIYFFALFSGNLIWMLLVLYARPGLKFMNAQPSHLFTSILICRLTLSLREANDRNGVVTSWGSDTYQGHHGHRGFHHETMSIEESMDFANHEMTVATDHGIVDMPRTLKDAEYEF